MAVGARKMLTRSFSAAVLLLSAACGDAVETAAPQVNFAQPFPAFARDLAAFPARHQGAYALPDDPARQLVIGARAVWQQQLVRLAETKASFDSSGLKPAPLGKWQMHQSLAYRLLRVRPDSVWLECYWPDTLFALTMRAGNRLRRWQGTYYLSYPDSASWRTERLVLQGQLLHWQALGTDTLRLAALPAGVVRRVGRRHWQLQPTSRPHARQVARYAGLWVEKGRYKRQ